MRLLGKSFPGKPYQKTKGPVWPQNRTELYARILALAGFRIDPRRTNCKTHDVLCSLLKDSDDKSRPRTIDNGLRHTGLTYHLRLTNHDGETALWGGNSPKMIHDHYKGLKTKKQAREFWAILPEGSDKEKIAADPRWRRLYKDVKSED